MKTIAKLLMSSSIILLGLNNNSIAENKFVTIKEYIKSRANPTEPYVSYIVNLRCAIVFKAINEISGKNNMLDVAANAKKTSDNFIELSSKYQTKANVSSETSIEDVKIYYGIYEDRLLKNYAVTGNYFDEPTFVDDIATCKALI